MRDRLLFQGYFAMALVAACSAAGTDGPAPPPDLSGGSTQTGGTGGVGQGGTLGIGGSAGTIMTTGGTSSGGTTGEDPDARVPLCTADCEDLASAGPIIDEGTPTNVPDMFGGAPSGTGPCVVEPGNNSLVPFNWLRPRVHIAGHQAGTMYQIKVSTQRERDVLTAYTHRDTWILPPEFWDNGNADAPKGLTYNVFDEDITIAVRASTGGETTVTFRIAPVKAGGSMVFWSSTTTEPGANTNALYGFAPGDEGVVVALKPLDVLEQIQDDNAGVPKRAIADGLVGAVPAGGVRCVGCHTSTPDGLAVNITDHWPWNVRLVNISGANRGRRPDYVTPMGDLLMQMPWQGVTSYSKADWEAGNRRYVTSFAKRPDTVATEPWKFWGVDCGGVECPYTGKDDLIWVNIAAAGTPPANNNDNAIPKALIAAQGTGWGVIARTGDTAGAVLPDFSHNGQSIVYTSTDSTADGHVGIQPYKAGATAPTKVDLYTVPFANGLGGAATPVAGAAEAAHAEYYADYAADDALIAYTRVSNFQQIFSAASNDEGKKIYYRPEAEVFVVRASGGEALRLEANNPATCSGQTSPGVYNSWPKWSPIVREAGGKKYYFLIFSSARQSPANIKTKEGTDVQPTIPMSQLYMAAVVDQGGTLTSYGPSYLWNQRYNVTGTVDAPVINDFVQSNVTPAWDEFQAPPVPPIVVVVK